MNRLFFLLIAIASLSPLYGQDIDLDKSSGLVQVDGRDAFYLKPTNKAFGKGNDFMLTNLEGEELAYLKYGTRPTTNWSSATHSYTNEVFYGVTFSRSGNYCELTDINTFSFMKIVARQIAAARLIKNGQISVDDERKFVVMHGGMFLKDPNAGPAVVFNNVPVPAPKDGTGVPKRTADIAISGDKIYNNDELLGTFQPIGDPVDASEHLKIYNTADALIIQAWHRAGGDWEVSAGTRRMTIRYHADAPLQKLFSRLVENGLFD